MSHDDLQCENQLVNNPQWDLNSESNTNFVEEYIAKNWDNVWIFMLLTIAVYGYCS
jgi:hypothetical protein